MSFVGHSTSARRIALFVWGLLAAWQTAAVGAEFADLPEVEFNKDIRGILADKCFACHGPDAGQRKADLRFDDQEIALGMIEPGKPDESELYLRITAEDPEERMPPAHSKKKLTEREIELLRRWIAKGAPWEAHWSYLPPTRDVPSVDSPAVDSPAVDSQSKANPIDAFIAARLRQQGLKLSEPADRRTLIRRLSFDLTGLPPTHQEVEAFLNDESPAAYENLVDRLLASQHFGERLAVYWLDMVRYADTNGIHGDNHRDHAPYRDYVIQSFNNNKPFDQFTIEQLAGDLLPNPTREQKIASGYNRLNMTTREGGAQAKEYQAKYAADRVRNASTVWMGATLGCAECHDHKFDPFSTREFYEFAAFFADVQETAVGVQQPAQLPTPEQQQQLAELDAQIGPLKKTLATSTPELEKAQQQWEQELRDRQVEWESPVPSSFESKGGAEAEIQPAGDVLVRGPNPDKDTYTLTFSLAEDRTVTALRLAVLPDDSLPQKGPGRAGNGNFVVNEIQLRTGDETLELGTVTATHSQDNWPAAAAADGKPNTGWAILPKVGAENHLVVELKQPRKLEAQQSWTVTLHFEHGGAHTLGHFQLAVTEAPHPVRAGNANGLPTELAAILALPADERDEAQRNKLAAHYRQIAPGLKNVRDRLAELEKQRTQIQQAAPKVLIAMSGTPRVTRVLPRGNWLDESGPVVQPGVPDFLLPLEQGEERASRVELAEWVVSPDNPLTARVFVNRLWKLAFGEGIVRTLDDFGSQGAWPTHPRLLDWLAVEFRESGWDVKHMVKLMVMSNTYRQSSLVSDELREKDPYNYLLARQNRFRLDAEFVRDNALAISGLLVQKVGGPSVKPYQPSGYWSHLNFPKRSYQHDNSEDQYRRGLYTYWCRTFLHPAMLAFDAPTREECSVARPRSNTPLAALVLLNDPSYVEASRAFAERILRAELSGEGSQLRESRIRLAFQQALNRVPTDQELAVLSPVVERHLEQYRESPEAAKEVLSIGLKPVPEDLDSAELAAWTSLSRIILNLHETITRS